MPSTHAERAPPACDARTSARRRQQIGWLLAVLGPPLLALAAVAWASRASGSRACCCSSCCSSWSWPPIGGLLPALVRRDRRARCSANFYFTPPLHTFTIAEGENLLALCRVPRRRRRRQLARRASRAGAPPTPRGRGPRPRRWPHWAGRWSPRRTRCRSSWPSSAPRSRSTRSRCCVRPDDGGWEIEAVAGEPVPVRPDEAALRRADRPARACSSVVGARALATRTSRCCASFAAQVQVAVERRRLRADVAAAAGLAEAQRAAHRAARRGLARPPHSARVDQGVGDEPAPAGRRVDARGDPRVPGDHRRGDATGSTRWWGTSST